MAVPPARMRRHQQPRQWRCRYSRQSHHCLLKQNFCHHGQHGTGEARQFCSLPVSIAAIFCAIPSRSAWLHFLPATYCPWRSLPTTPAGLQACHPVPAKLVFSRPVFFCSDMTLFSASGLSPYCSSGAVPWLPVLPAGQSAPGFRINGGPFCPLLLCEFIRLLRSAFRRS